MHSVPYASLKKSIKAQFAKDYKPLQSRFRFANYDIPEQSWFWFGKVDIPLQSWFRFCKDDIPIQFSFRFQIWKKKKYSNILTIWDKSVYDGACLLDEVECVGLKKQITVNRKQRILFSRLRNASLQENHTARRESVERSRRSIYRNCAPFGNN